MNKHFAGLAVAAAVGMSLVSVAGVFSSAAGAEPKTLQVLTPDQVEALACYMVSLRQPGVPASRNPSTPAKPGSE